MAKKIISFLNASEAKRVNSDLVGAFKSGDLAVVNAKIEDVDVPMVVDIIISEPIGVFLVHERMLESFVHARQYLRDPANMYPTTGTMYLALYEDHLLYNEYSCKSEWWDTMYSVDFSVMKDMASEEVFRQCIVGNYTSNILVSDTSERKIDFRSITIQELETINIPIRFNVYKTSVVHGLAGWFDCEFITPSTVFTLSTHPDQPLTHWQQIRFMFREPLGVNKGDVVEGEMRMRVNESRSYSIECEVRCGLQVRRDRWELHEQVYHYTQQQQ